ncbi:MAG: hypothetical protein WD887_01150 [Candidatus Saccharimonadales bacterium]
MARNSNTSALVDGLLRFVATGGMVTASLLLPGLAIGLNKPLSKFLDGLDEAAKRREIDRTLKYMKAAKLINYSGKYEHGIAITGKGRKRLEKVHFEDIAILTPKQWDQRWRLVIFDVPEEHKQARNALSRKLRELGFQPLQRSVWVHPFACHAEIEAISIFWGLTNYLTYVETSYIDKPDLLKSRFANILKF